MGKSVESLTADLAESTSAVGGRVSPETGTERAFAGLLAGVVGVEWVSVESHFFDDLGADSLTMARFCARVRKQPDLPPVSMKDIYQHPTIRGLASALTDAALSPVERTFAETLAGVVGAERVSVESHFFDDLGADSLTMARFCARVRKQPDLPPVSMKDIYQHPTIRGLASALTDAVAHPIAATVSAPTLEPTAPASTRPMGAAGTWSYVSCGALQLLFFLGYAYLATIVMVRGYEWISTGSGLLDIYLRSVAFGGGLFIGLSTFPILAKWVLIGRWKRRQIRIWSLAYVRFWIVKTLLRSNPAVILFHGSPLYAIYLRALGAKVGKCVVFLSRTPPICTDLVTIGAGTVVRKDAILLGYRAHAGQIETGAITLGRDAFVGEKAVLDINTSVGNEAQLGHTSALHSGQSVPDGERWHGSPAQPAGVDYLRVPPARSSSLRRAGYSIVTLLQLFFLILPLGEGGLYMLLAEIPSLSKLLDPNSTAIMSPELYVDALLLSLAVFCGATILGLLLVFAAPRLLRLFVTPDKVYPLYGFHHGIHRAIARMTNVKFFTHLFGDSSYIVPYLRRLGYDLKAVEQTGSNFGTEVSHETPFLSSVGSGTMVADGLSMMNADFSSTSFRVSRVAIGSHNFVGNRIAYPAGGRTGDNCLLATKAMIPLDGKVREGVGLLGSPCFEIPRSVQRDGRFDHLATGDEFRRRLSAKNRVNLRSMGLFLVLRWVHIFLLTVLGLIAVDIYSPWMHVVAAASLVVSVLISAAYLMLVERAIARFRPLKPQYCSIYDPYFWWHERLWKVTGMAYMHMFDGTPFKSIVWRALGVRVGRRLFDDGLGVTERTLATIGDDCTLNPGSILQCHSQEDGAFKSDHITIGDGVTLGVGAFVHYGVTMHEGSVLAPDSFLMKGEEVPPGARWGGNPAVELPNEDHQPFDHQTFDHQTFDHRPSADEESERLEQARFDAELSELERDADLDRRLNALDSDINALRAEGERATTDMAQQEELVAQLRPSIDQLKTDRTFTKDLIRGGTTNGSQGDRR